MQASTSTSPSLRELSLWDARMWTTQNDAMLAWQLQLKQRGTLTAILSNMGDSVHANIERECDWISRFDVLVWSYELRMAKPDPAIYRHVLKELGTLPEETLFIDDKLVNIDAARALGIKAVQFTNVDQLRSDLIAQGLDKDLPLPAKPEPNVLSLSSLVPIPSFLAFTTPSPAPPGWPRL